MGTEKDNKENMSTLVILLVVALITILGLAQSLNKANKKIEELQLKIDTKQNQSSGVYRTQQPCAGC